MANVGLQRSKPELQSPVGYAQAHVDDDKLWATRNQHWLTETRKRRRYHAAGDRGEPLVLCGHGVHLGVKGGALVVRTGLTHHPQDRETLTFFKGAVDLPSKIVMLDGSGSLSFDVMSWLSEQRIPLLRISWQGEAVSLLGGTGTPFDARRVSWQVVTKADEARRLGFCRELIAEKINASVVTLKTALPPSEARTKAAAVAELIVGRLAQGDGHTVRDILTMEARAAAAYFLAWRVLPLRWTGLKQRPVPEAWKTVSVRRSYSSFRSHSTNRHAIHPVNALLNYAYAILHSQMQIDLVSAGYDPRRGIMHEDRLDSCALVLDVMEVHRPMVDAAVLKFAAASGFSAADFVIRADGVCRLAPQLARRVAQVAVSALQDARASGTSLLSQAAEAGAA